MIEKEIEIINKLGLHARAAAKLVNTAASFASSVSINFADQQSIMSVMMLAASQGSMINITCDGNDEVAALEAITHLINDYFGEEE